MNKLLIITIMIFLSFYITSCMTGFNVRKSRIKYFDNSFSAVTSNNAFKVKGLKKGVPNLLGSLEMYDIYVDSLTITFSNENELIISYINKDKDSNKVYKSFKGKFTKDGYYEIFLRNESKEIPPYFPILFARYNINRIRIALIDESDLIIDNFWDEGGHILILGAGDTGRRQCIYKMRKLK